MLVHQLYQMYTLMQDGINRENCEGKDGMGAYGDSVISVQIFSKSQTSITE